MSGATDSLLPSLSDDEKIRYSRHLCLPQFGETGQRRLKNARVLLVGLGGLGSPAALYLTAAGVGTLGIAEIDTVTAHNLQRQILFRENDIGKSKLATGVAALRALNPHVTVVAHADGLTPENALTLFADYDIILDATDNFSARYLANDAAFFARRPLVHGSISPFAGQVTLLDTPSDGPCYRCLFPEMPVTATPSPAAQTGVIGAQVGVVGSEMAMEAIKRVTGVGASLRGRLRLHDFLAGDTRTVRVQKNPDCPLCGNTPRITGVVTANYAAVTCRIAR